MASSVPSADSSTPTEVCHNERVDRESAPGLFVRDAMVASPKTVPADATAGDLRAMFANAHVVTALLVDGPRFAGVVHRSELPNEISDAHPARELARLDVPTTEPDAPLADALAVLDSSNDRRLVVVDPERGDLRGLLCLTSDRRGFCQS
jgi:CBS domain-containing protein